MPKSIYDYAAERTEAVQHLAKAYAHYTGLDPTKVQVEVVFYVDDQARLILILKAKERKN